MQRLQALFVSTCQNSLECLFSFKLINLYIVCVLFRLILNDSAMIANFTKPEKLLFTKRNLEKF